MTKPPIMFSNDYSFATLSDKPYWYPVLRGHELYWRLNTTTTEYAVEDWPEWVTWAGLLARRVTRSEIWEHVQAVLEQAVEHVNYRTDGRVAAKLTAVFRRDYEQCESVVPGQYQYLFMVNNKPVFVLYQTDYCRAGLLLFVRQPGGMQKIFNSFVINGGNVLVQRVNMGGWRDFIDFGLPVARPVALMLSVVRRSVWDCYVGFLAECSQRSLDYVSRYYYGGEHARAVPVMTAPCWCIMCRPRMYNGQRHIPFRWFLLHHTGLVYELSYGGYTDLQLKNLCSTQNWQNHSLVCCSDHITPATWKMLNTPGAEDYLVLDSL